MGYGNVSSAPLKNVDPPTPLPLGWFICFGICESQKIFLFIPSFFYFNSAVLHSCASFHFFIFSTSTLVSPSSYASLNFLIFPLLLSHSYSISLLLHFGVPHSYASLNFCFFSLLLQCLVPVTLHTSSFFHSYTDVFFLCLV